MSKLYELNQRYANILEVAEMMEPEDVKEVLDGINDEIEIKAENYAKVIKSLENTAEGLKKEATRLNDRKKAIDNNIKQMKESLQNSMLLTGKKKFKTDLFSFNIQNNPPSLSVLSEDNIPKQFYIEKEPQLDKKSLLKHLKESGEELTGVEIKQSESLRIR